MATIATLRAQVKDFADIKASDTTFDTDIDAYLVYAIKSLTPIALKEVAPDTSKTFSANARDVTLPSGTVDVRRLELYDSDVADYLLATDWTLHGGSIWLDSPVYKATVARIWGLAEYSQTGSDLPTNLELPVIYWATSQLYDSFAGNRRKYNIYVGTTGAAADRDMKDSATYYKQRGDELLLDRISMRGR